MKLIWAAASPYARKAMITAHELGIADRIEPVSGGGTPMEPNPMTVSHNPLGKLPCLIRDEAPAIYDSPVICQYLTSLVPDQKLLPEGHGRWSALTLEALADGICDAAILIRYETLLREPDMQSASWKGAQMTKIDNALNAAEDGWSAHLAGPFDLGHAALGAALGYLDFRFSDKDWRSGHPGLAKWFEGFSQRPSAIATVPAA